MKRRRAMSGRLLGALLCSLAGCSGGAQGPGQTDAGEEVGVAPDVPPDEWISRDALPDVQADETTWPDRYVPDLPDVGADFVLQPCLSHSDCEDGFCVEYPPESGNYFCAQSCVEWCPGGLVCKSIYLDGPDPVSVCLPPGDTLCKVCQKDVDCLISGSLCIRGKGVLGFCGAVCNPQQAKCPAGFDCALYVDPAGEEQGFQCQPSPGSCCVAGARQSCDDENPCTEEQCSPSLGCQHKPADGPCEGDDDCLDYACKDGKCQGSPKQGDYARDGFDEDCDGLTDEDAYKQFRVAGYAFVATWSPYGKKVPAFSGAGTLGSTPWGDIVGNDKQGIELIPGSCGVLSGGQ